VKSLLDTGRVLIDLAGLCCQQSALITVFPAALALAGGWPLGRLVMYGAPDELGTMLVGAGVPETVPLADDLPTARALLEQRPAQLRRHCDLSLYPGAPSAARLFVRQTCALWSLSQILEERAELVSSELVINVIQHAHTSSRLTLTCTRSMLRVSVRDYRPTPAPRPRPIEIDAPSGRGLHLVTVVAHSWGATQHPDGKTIWANLVDGKQPEGPGR
jgi:anti-sigma regulatory factor (Ser/Thr protein kinase)